MKVLVTSKSFGKLSRKPIQRLQDAGFEVYGNEKGRLLNEEEMVEAIQGMDAVILGTEVFNRNVIDHADKLKIVSRYGVGLDKIDVEYLKEKGIALQIARNANTNSVADHTIGLMLSLCHNITRSDANIRSHVWKKPIAKDLYQSTVGILGLGAIGKAVARRLKGFDCHILAFDSYYDEAFIREYGIRKADINEIVSSSDFLTLHLPALAEFSPLLLEKLKQFDTPSITNVVATYPDKEYCLGLYHPWRGQWYTDERARVMYPELGRTVGYAVTCTYGLPDPNYECLKFADVLKAVAAVGKPVVLIVKQDMPEEIKCRNGLLGGNMMTALRSAGCVGVISDGPSRDVDEIRPLQMQYVLSGVTAGHGKWAVQSVNTGVEVFGMQVSPGEIIHMDENGAVKFPASVIDQVIEKAEYLQEFEENRQRRMRETEDVDELIKIMSGFYD